MPPVIHFLRPSCLLCLLPLCGLLLAGCEQLGIEDPAKIAEARDAEGRAVGGACRHSGRALEDCYKLNSRASKAAIYAGWRDMDTYMRENNIAVVPSGSTTAGRKALPSAPPAEAAPAEAAPKAGPARSAAESPQSPAPSTSRRST